MFVIDYTFQNIFYFLLFLFLEIYSNRRKVDYIGIYFPMNKVSNIRFPAFMRNLFWNIHRNAFCTMELHTSFFNCERLEVSRARKSRPVDTIRLVIQTSASFNAFRGARDFQGMFEHTSTGGVLL